LTREKRVEIIIVVLILALSLGLRLAGLNRFIVCDEVRWTCRSVNFQQALFRGDWRNTYRTGHPGVVTTWLGSLFIHDDDPRMRAMCQETLDGRKVVWAGETREERTDLMHRLGSLLFQGRVGVGVFTWICIVAIYLLTRHLWGARIAVLSLVFTALDPFYLGLSRFLHVDAVLTSLMMVSVLGLIAYTRRSGSRRRRTMALLLSGVATGLAMLQKSPAMFLGPFAVLVLGLDVLRQGLSRSVVARAVRDLLIWGIVALAIYVAMWPALWVSPVDTVTRVVGKALGYAQEGHGSGNYFMGRPDEDPGWLFYPIATAFRFSPLALIGLFCGSFGVLSGKSDQERRFGIVVLLAYGLAFWAFMSLGDKMFDRYFLPVFPALAIVAAAGVWWAIDALSSRFEGPDKVLKQPLLVPALALIIQIAITVPHHPHYLTYYNPLLGGGRQAEKVLLMGWGEGMEQVAAHLNAKSNAEDLQVAMSAFPSFAPQFDGDTRSIENYSVWETDYVMFYLSHVQRLHNQDLLSEYLFNADVEPEKVVTLHGVDYVWLYPNRHYVEPMAYIEERAISDGDSCILVNGDSLFAKYYKGSLSLVTFQAEWDRREEYYIYPLAEEVDALLRTQAPQCERVWYVRYPETERRMYIDLLENQALLEQRAEFPQVLVSEHRIVIDDVVPQSVDYVFGGLHLTGYGITDPPPAWGVDAGVTLAFESRSSFTKDYSVFLHLYDDQGHRIAQNDRLIRDKAGRPTSDWPADHTGVGLYHLAIAPGTPPGEYALKIGVYDWKTGEHLHVEGEAKVEIPVWVDVPPEPPHPAELRIPHWVEREVTPELRLLGHELGNESLVAGDTLYIRLFWETLAQGNELHPVDEDHALQLGLRGFDGELYGARRFDLVRTNYPTSRWRRGELLQERYYLPVSEDVPTGEATVELNLLGEDGELVPSEPVEVARIWVQSPEPSFEAPAALPNESGVVFGDRVQLLGYDLEISARAGGDIDVTLHWQAEREMEKTYKAFVHLYDESGALIAQQDGPPGLGARPTEIWREGEVVSDRYRIPVEREMLPGTYLVGTGLYDAGSGERLATVGPDGERLDQDRVILGTVEILP